MSSVFLGKVRGILPEGTTSPNKRFYRQRKIQTDGKLERRMEKIMLTHERMPQGTLIIIIWC